MSNTIKKQVNTAVGFKMDSAQEPYVTIDYLPWSQRDNERLLMKLSDAEVLYEQLGKSLPKVRAAYEAVQS